MISHKCSVIPMLPTSQEPLDRIAVYWALPRLRVYNMRTTVTRVDAVVRGRSMTFLNITPLL